MPVVQVVNVQPLSHALDEVRTLLAANELPIDDLDDPSVQLFVARDNTTLVGVVGFQRCNDLGLLRSLAVTPAARHRGVGARLCTHVLDHASQHGLSSIYLLTTSASDYFARHGFVTIDRDKTPPAIRATAQFSSLCPSSAIVMRLRTSLRAP